MAETAHQIIAEALLEVLRAGDSEENVEAAGMLVGADEQLCRWKREDWKKQQAEVQPLHSKGETYG